MAMKAISLTVVLCHALLFSAASGAVVLGSHHPASLKYVGSADHKSFFVDTEKKLGSHAAGSYCQDFNLKLASVDSQEQVDMLQNALPEYGFPKAYYTNGREVITLINSETGANLDTSIFNRVRRIPNEIPAACAQLVIEGETSHQLQFWDCAYSAHPLCST